MSYKKALLASLLSLTVMDHALAQAITSTVTTAAASAFCSSSSQSYPVQGIWGNSPIPTETDAIISPTGAPSVSPLITQMRGGQPIAYYTTFASSSTCQYIDDGTDWQQPWVAAKTGCGPFAFGFSRRLWAPGDVFVVAPAIYTGPLNQPYFGPEFDGGTNASSYTPMKDITITGGTQNGYRPVLYYNPSFTDIKTGADLSNTLSQAPVYFDASDGVTWNNIDVVAGPGAMGYLALGTAPNAPLPNANNTIHAAVYDVGASNFTFSNSRVSGFEVENLNYYIYSKNHYPNNSVPVGTNGFAGAGNYSGTMTFSNDEFDHNGGYTGNYVHNVYLNPSLVDPNFKFIAKLNYFHDVWNGHLLKSRSQQNDIESNYFQGGLPQSGLIPATADIYLLDIPNGGVLTAHGNLFAKNASGFDSNGVSIAYGEEGLSTLATFPAFSIDIEHNTFRSFAQTFDGNNPIYPFLFIDPANPGPPTQPVIPGTPGFPSNIPFTIQGNMFGGYCPSGLPTPNFLDYRGDLAVIAAPSEINSNFVGPTYTYAGTDPNTTTGKYYHVATTIHNFTPANHVGAEN